MGADFYEPFTVFGFKVILEEYIGLSFLENFESELDKILEAKFPGVCAGHYYTTTHSRMECVCFSENQNFMAMYVGVPVSGRKTIPTESELPTREQVEQIFKDWLKERITIVSNEDYEPEIDDDEEDEGVLENMLENIKVKKLKILSCIC